MGVLLFFAILIGLPILVRRMTKGERSGVIAAVVVAVLVSGSFIVASSIRTLSPGQMGRAYNLSGNAKEMTVGYNFVAPWNSVYTWDMRSQSLNFSEGDAVDDAFGAQTKNGDYLTAIANITVRIDPVRLDQYIDRFGNESIDGNRKISLILKNELKRAMENALKDYETRDLMSSKAKASGEARELALTYLSELPFVVETLWFVDFEASAEYETAIREQADLRMRTDKAALQEMLNEQEAKNNKVKADGEAEVLRIAARAEADAKEITAKNEATIAQITAERDANVKKIAAEAEANATITKAEADASARVAQDTAEAQGAEAIGNAYKANPELMELKRIELEQEWAKAWNGMMPQFQGMSSFNFADMTGIIRGLLPEGEGAAQTDSQTDGLTGEATP